jgi:hypothetical protein
VGGAHQQHDRQRVGEVDLPQLAGGAAHAGEVAALQRGAQPGVRSTLDRHEHTFPHEGGQHQSRALRLRPFLGGRFSGHLRLTAPPVDGPGRIRVLNHPGASRALEASLELSARAFSVSRP